MNEPDGKPDRNDPRRKLLISDLENITASWLTMRKKYERYDKDADRLRRLGMIVENGKIENWDDVKEKSYDEDDLIKVWGGWFKWKWWDLSNNVKSLYLGHMKVYLNRYRGFYWFSRAYSSIDQPWLSV